MLCCSSQLELGLLSSARAVFAPHLPTGNVHATRESAIAKQWRCMSPKAMQDDDLDHLNVTLRETCILSRYSGNHRGQLMMSNTWSLCGKLVQFLRDVASTNENPTNVCSILVLS